MLKKVALLFVSLVAASAVFAADDRGVAVPRSIPDSAICYYDTGYYNPSSEDLTVYLHGEPYYPNGMFGGRGHYRPYRYDPNRRHYTGGSSRRYPYRLSPYRPVEPAEPTVQVPELCKVCGGSGSCVVCHGAGFTSSYGYTSDCTACDKTGKCRYCNKAK